MLKTNKFLLVTAIAVALSACSKSDSDGNSGYGNNSDGISSFGIAVDGYLSGSTVTCDLNDNGIADAAEPYTISLDNGLFTFTPECEFPILVTGGMNIVSDGVSYPFLGSLKAPAGSNFVTPLTTLMVDADANSAEMAEMLGATGRFNPHRSNPLKNLNLYKQTLAVNQIIQGLANIFGITPADTQIYALVAKKLAEALDSNTPLFDSEGNINIIILQNVAAAVNAEFGNAIPAGSLALVVDDIADQVGQIMSVKNIAQLEIVAETLQDPANEPVITTLAQMDYLYLKNDAFKINGNAIPYSTFTSAGGANTAKLATIGFDFDIFGNPDIDQTVQMVLTLNSVSGIRRQLEVMINEVDIVKNPFGKLAVSIPANAKLYVFGHSSSGSDINLTLNNLSENIVSVNQTTNEVTLNYTNIIQRIIDNPQTASVTDAVEELLNPAGTFTAQLVVSNLNFRYADNTALPIILAGVTNAVNASNQPVPSVIGYGLAGKLVIAP